MLILVLGHTDFSWMHNSEVAPLGHTPFSWNGTCGSGTTSAVSDNEETHSEKGKVPKKKAARKGEKKRKEGNPKSIDPPMKVLCLHGYLQSGPIWEKKTSSFRYAYNYQ